MVSVNFFCFMKSIKKVVGLADLLMLSGGESELANKDSSAGTGAFYLPEMLLTSDIRIVLPGSKSGFWNARRMRA